jgi:hypothetical protein
MTFRPEIEKKLVKHPFGQMTQFSNFNFDDHSQIFSVKLLSVKKISVKWSFSVEYVRLNDDSGKWFYGQKAVKNLVKKLEK